MKILIIEDNPHKLVKTIDYIEDVSPDALEIDVADTVREGYMLSKDTKYDRIVIDMQLPSLGDGHVDREGGIQILQYLEDSINEDTPRVINSSSEETREVLDNNNYKDEKLIINSSMYDCTRAFKKFICPE